MNAFDEMLGRPVSMRAFALLRIAAGPIVLLHLRPFLIDAGNGVIYRDAFYDPYARWYPELGRSLYVGLLFAGAVLALAMTIGVATRVVTVALFAVVTYNVFLSTTHFHNNRAYLIIVLGLLALAPCGREISFDAWWRRKRGRPALPSDGPGWPLWLARFETTVVYGASGLSKLVDRDWIGGTVTWDRMVRAQDRMRVRTPTPDWVISILTDRSFHTVVAKVLVATELAIAIGLWSRRTRYAAIWLAVVFHVVIELSASVQVFSYLAVAALVVWAVPSTRDRVAYLPAGWVPWVRGLDWLARFRIQALPPGLAPRVVDRDGRERTGRAAGVFVASRLPLTAWVALPLLLVRWKDARRWTSKRSSTI